MQMQVSEVKQCWADLVGTENIVAGRLEQILQIKVGNREIIQK